jgi:hypothetical protein
MFLKNKGAIYEVMQTRRKIKLRVQPGLHFIKNPTSGNYFESK